MVPAIHPNAFRVHHLYEGRHGELLLGDGNPLTATILHVFVLHAQTRVRVAQTCPKRGVWLQDKPSLQT